MKTLIFLSISALLITSCQRTDKEEIKMDKEEIKKEIFKTEKDFEKMAAEKGIAEAFHFFADERGVIKRENDSLIVGSENIKLYYEKKNFDSTTVVNWTPDFIDVADDGSLAYTYGHFVWKFKDDQGAITEYKGVFHTVWKKQTGGDWKYVWD